MLMARDEGMTRPFPISNPPMTKSCVHQVYPTEFPNGLTAKQEKYNYRKAQSAMSGRLYNSRRAGKKALVFTAIIHGY